jgi:hypothetical protein
MCLNHLHEITYEIVCEDEDDVWRQSCGCWQVEQGECPHYAQQDMPHRGVTVTHHRAKYFETDNFLWPRNKYKYTISCRNCFSACFYLSYIHRAFTVALEPEGIHDTFLKNKVVHNSLSVAANINSNTHITFYTLRTMYIVLKPVPLRCIIVECVEMQVERNRVTLRLAVYRQSLRLGDNPLRLTTSNFIIQLNTCGYSPCVTPSLTKGWVCRLQLLLVLASAVILRSEPRGSHDHILLSQIRDPRPNLEGQVPVFISPRNRTAQLYPQGTGFPFRRLLRLAGLRWKYSNLPPHGMDRNMSCLLVISCG